MVKQSFNDWFSVNYATLKSKVLPYNLFGELYNTTFEDVFHDSYLIALDAVNKVCADNPAIYELTFVASYKRQIKTRYCAELKEIRPKDFFWACLTGDDDDNNENERKENRWDRISSLADEILKFARVTFSKSEYDLFCLYFKNGLTSYECADIFGVTQGTCYYRISNMKHIICAAFENELKNL